MQSILMALWIITVRWNAHEESDRALVASVSQALHHQNSLLLRHPRSIRNSLSKAKQKVAFVFRLFVPLTDIVFVNAKHAKY